MIEKGKTAAVRSLRTAQRTVERLLGVRVMRSVPHGVELQRDVGRSLPALCIETVFDVGANIGQTATELLGACPGARIHCFEPISATFATLRQRFAEESRVSCWKLAMGREPATVVMSEQSISTTSRVTSGAHRPQEAGGHEERVEMSTISLFCASHGIDRINLLKIDTEGLDLEVLLGADDLLGEQRVDIIQIEVGMSRSNEQHVPFDAACRFMRERGYHLFGIYNQALEWPTSEPRLRRSDVVFVSDPTVRANCDKRGAPYST